VCTVSATMSEIGDGDHVEEENLSASKHEHKQSIFEV